MEQADPRNPANNVAKAFERAETYTKIMEREMGTQTFEMVVGVMVLMCCSKPDSTGPAFINAMLHDTPWRLVNKEAH